MKNLIIRSLFAVVILLVTIQSQVSAQGQSQYPWAYSFKQVVVQGESPISVYFYVAIGPKRNQPDLGKTYLQSFKQNMYVGLRNGDFTTLSCDSLKFLSELSNNELVYTDSATGLWKGRFLDPSANYEKSFYDQFGTVAVFGAFIDSPNRTFSLSGVTTSVVSSDSAVLPSTTEDYGAVDQNGQPLYMYNYPAYVGYSASNGQNYLSNPGWLPVNQLSVLFYCQGVNMDVFAGDQNAQLASALQQLSKSCVLTPSVSFTPAGFQTSITVTSDPITSVGLAPAITQQPSDSQTRQGWNATFSVATTGYNLTDASYVWYVDGQPFATGPSAVLQNVQFSDSGRQVYVVVSNLYGSVQSNKVTLTVTPVPPPVAITRLAQVITPTSAVLSSTVGINGEVTTAYFEYGQYDPQTYDPTNLTYTSTTSVVTLNQDSVVNVQIGGAEAPLTPGKNYHYRVVAQSRGGVSFGGDYLFITPFLSDTFGPVAGTYTGLLSDSSNNSQGQVTLVVTNKGKFTASIGYQSKRYTLLGAFDVYGNFTGVIGKTGLSVTFNLDTFRGTDELQGELVNGIDVLSLLAKRFVYSKTNPASQEAGTFRIVTSTGSNDLTLPQGNGSGTVTISVLGRTRTVGHLPDGTYLSQGGLLAEDGTFAFYQVLPYRIRGVVAGWLSVQPSAPPPRPQLGSSALFWSKPVQKLGAYAQGFTTVVNVEGSTYIPPSTAVTRSMNQRIYVLIHSGGLSQDLNLKGQLQNGKVSFTPDQRVSMAVSFASGTVSGRFYHPDLKRNISYTAVILQRQGKAAGSFIVGSTYGSVEVSGLSSW